MKTILVTGGAGFIGSNLCNYFLKKGEHVVAIDNFITAEKQNLSKLKKHSNFRFINHDIVKPFPKSLISQLSSLNSVFHLACPTGVPNLVPLAEEMLLTCSIGTRNVLELAREKRAQVVFTSSSEVYGDPKEFPQKETYTGNVDITGIRSPYEEGKRFSESLIMMYVRKYGVDARILRVFNTYGTNMAMSDTRVIPVFLQNALSGKALPVEGDGSQKRTFCYVDDLVSALVTVSEKGKKGEVYNAGGDREITIKKLAEIIIKITNSKSKIKYVKRPSHDHQSRKPDLAKIKHLGWKQKVEIEEGIRMTLQSLKDVS